MSTKKNTNKKNKKPKAEEKEIKKTTKAANKKETTKKKVEQKKEEQKKQNTKNIEKADNKNTKKTEEKNKKVSKKDNKENLTKETKNLEKKPIESSVIKESAGEMVKLLKIIIVITLIMVAIYLVTMFVTKKADEAKDLQKISNKTEVATQIQYENIMIGTMLNHNGTYYVLIKEDGDNRVSEYESLVNSIKYSDDAPTIYSANLTDSFNKGYLAKEEKHETNDIKEFRVSGTTLVKVSDKKIDSVYNTYDSIKKKLNELK